MQEANVSTPQPQQEQQPMQTATTDGPSFAPISDRRGGPMDLGEPMQDIQPLPSQQQQQHDPSMALSSSNDSEPFQQQKQQHSQQSQSHPHGEGQYDPQMLMHPLQPQISNQSTQSNQSFQSVESDDSSSQQQPQPPQQSSGGGFSEDSAPYQQQPQPQQYHHPQLQQPYTNPSQATTSSSLTSALGHLAPPQHDKSRSRRWSITGRFFEKRKSITEPFHVPGGAPPSSFSSSYKSTNANIVNGADGKGGSWGGPESSFGDRAQNNGGNFNHTNNTSNHNNNNTTTASTMGAGSYNSQSNGNGTGDSKNNSPPGSNGNSRRSSLADLPKAILSSLRRSSLVGPSDTCSMMATAATSMGGNGAGQGAGGMIVEEDEDLDEDGGGPRILMATPKAPPQNPHLSRPPPKSILKKRSSESKPATAGASGVDSAADGATASTEDVIDPTAAAAAGANATATANADADATSGQQTDQTLSSETVHPMATADMDVVDINLLTPTDHRARLLTHSPTPNHPQQHLVNENSDKNPTLIGGAGSPKPSNNTDSVSSNNSNNKVQQGTVSSSQGAALPPDFTPGVQSNSYYKDRGGERGQGSVGDFISQDELLTQQMIGISSRAQDLANQYYGTNNSNHTNNQTSSSAPHTLAPIASAAAGAARRRSINFLETVEIIPVHRKSDYNRQSDKHATFKILTPDMKSEIRDELNTYKMREMAVHVESMANTAFH
ncbi:hypothetical protein BGZ90_008495 [Linnemannia elongata]|nr:hypothetical protein BGZ90_008495 [Linnemannia elongata]